MVADVEHAGIKGALRRLPRFSLLRNSVGGFALPPILWFLELFM
jgi:hypothetical protein